jgi:hypothetical protein
MSKVTREALGVRGVLRHIASAVLAAGTIFFGAHNAQAQKSVSFKITGSANPPVPGACASGSMGVPYDSICISGDCMCIEIMGATVSGSLGKGTADFLQTYDFGFADTTSDPNATCLPSFGIINVTTTSKTGTQTETLNISGLYCNTTNPEVNTFYGGFGVAQTPAPSPNPLSGAGSVIAPTITNGGGTLTFKGVLTE